MSLKRLLEQFGTREELPIEIDEVRDSVLALGVDDRIIITPVDKPISEVRGTFYRWIERPGVYSSPLHCIGITFSTHQSEDWQRVVCCKELVHSLDHQGSHTSTRNEVISLAARLLGPMSTGDVSSADFMASTDQIALYYALAVLFPKAARDAATKEVAAGRLSIQKLAEACRLPMPMVQLIISEDWPGILEVLLDC